MSIGKLLLTCGLVLALLSPHAAGAGQQIAEGQKQAAKGRLLDVPFVPQSEALCGGAAAAMLFRYWHDRPSHAEDFASLVDDSAEGIRLGDLTRAVRERGWQALPFAGTSVDVRVHIDQGRPVIALIEDRPGRFHYVVVVAWTNERVVFHDPARGPFRVTEVDSFDRVWAVTNRTALLIVPGSQTPSEPIPSVTSADASATPVSPSCAKVVEEAVQAARAGDLNSAEELLNVVDQTCPLSSSAPRELAGIRFVQRRWADASALAERAIARDPSDMHAWQLLATARFLSGDSGGALHAWNSRSEPRVDLARVEGLDRTHHDVVSGLLDLPSQSMLTANQLQRARRRVAELPSLQMSRVSYTPRASGLATVDVAVVERPLVPRTWPTVVATGVHASTAREIRLEIASPSGNGELWVGKWRWWPNRPRVGVSLALPRLGRWTGLWRIDGEWERETIALTDSLALSERRRAAVTFGDWRSGNFRWEATGALEHWRGESKRFSIGAAVERRLFDDRMALRLDGALWPSIGRAAGFRSGGASSAWRFDLPARTTVTALTGVQLASTATPLALWPAADTGHVRSTLLRAHPLLTDGVIRASGLGRVLAHSTVELQRDLAIVPLARLRWAVFVDAARQERMATSAASTTHVDIGVGLRAELPGTPGTLRVDLARGVRDGQMAFSAAWQPTWPGW
ncbi:MAG TPA: C39 family peptidase [Vicinamibacterales bacterium]|nr:C39 family peptidase [Vicinamibacterales bacterium]